MKFYRENSINPAASCLPLLAQLPVFFALYLVLNHFSKHPPPGDLGWLTFVPNIAEAATSHWSGYLLLVIYVASQMASSLYMSATIDKTQRMLFMLMPLVFVFFIAHFPVGLVLYWLTTNLWTVGQGLITRRLMPKTPAPSLVKRTSRAPAKEPAGEVGASGGTRAPAKANPAQPQVRKVKKKRARR
jgi:YidC/Oxa1 family membrane protein insertase